MKRNVFKAGILVFLVISSCSVLRKESTDADIRNFLLSFQKSLTLPEKEILAQFETKQSKDIVHTAISLLTNKEHEFIVCNPAFNAAEIIKDERGLKINIPVSFKSQNIEEEYSASSNLVLWLKQKNESFVITKVEADDFYKAFAKIKHEMEWLVERKREILNREPYYATAKALQHNFDSVIWFTTYEEKDTYYYVVEGQWINYFRDYGKKPMDMQASMGLINEDGEVVIPIAYDLIGTLGFDRPGLVEVNRGGKVGYYNFTSGKEIIPPVYDIIIPYGKSGINFIVKKDSTYGWLDNRFEYTRGFPSTEIERWVKEFRFLPADLQLDADNQNLSEIPGSDHAGFGIIIPPSYLVKTGIFSEIVAGISPTDFPINGWTDFVETKGTILERINQSIQAVVTTIRERYLDGRQEFYTYNRLTFVGPEQDTLAVASLGSAEHVSFKVMGSVLEASCMPDIDYYFENSYWPDVMPMYAYYSLSEDLKISPLKSERSFPQTQFVMLDSTYFHGKFKRHVTEQTDTLETMGFKEFETVSKVTLEYMRNEILASYGFKFDNGETDNYYSFKDVSPRTREEIELVLTDIDRHNLTFLEKLIEDSPPSEAPAVTSL